MSPVRELLVELGKLDLGSKPETYPCAPCGPCEKPRRYFPTVYISDQENAVDIPDEGTATIQYRVRGRSMNDRDGKKRHSADIEIQTIDTGKEPAAKKEPKEGDAAVLLKTPAMTAMEDLRAVVQFARGDMMAKILNPEKLAQRLGGAFPVPARGSVLAPSYALLMKRKKLAKLRGVAVETLDGPRVMRATKPKTMRTELARGDVILRNLDKLPVKTAKRITGSYDSFKPILGRDLQGHKAQLKKHMWPSGGLFRDKEVDRMAGSGLRLERDKLARAIRKGRGENRVAAMAAADIAKANRKIGFSARILSDIIELDSRPRNNNGQFVGAETGGADPDSMHAAYGPGTVAKAAGLGAVAGAGVVGGLQITKARKALSKLAR